MDITNNYARGEIYKLDIHYNTLGVIPRKVHGNMQKMVEEIRLGGNESSLLYLCCAA